MHLYVKKIEDKDCDSNGIMLTHDIVRFFFNPEKSFFESLEANKSYPFAHFKNASEIKDINVRKNSGFFYIDSAIVSLLKENHEDMAIEDLLYVEQVETTYRIKLIKVGDQNYETFNILLNKNDRHLLLLSDEKESNEENDLETSKKEKNPDQPLDPPKQIIYYGVPGCGKSYEVNKEIDGKLVGIQDKEYHKVRCVFHPEYSNADFVGQIYPKIEEKTNAGGSTSSVVVYEFKPGPFAEIVRRAYQNPDEPFFLIIEEINRGNAAAIFGESFQLLDRIKIGEPADDSTENVYGEGWSSYGIDNQDVNAYIRDQQRKNADKQKGHCSCVKGGCSDAEQESKFRSYPFVDISSEKINTTWVHKDGGAEKREEKTLHFSANTAIRLPPNLSIYATMNTSDQNVITMDNAFQRRFKSRMIRNDLDNAAQYNIKIEGTNVCWGAFRKWVNEKILSTPNISKADDKCLGGWFISTSVKRENNVTKFEDISRVDFAEKVIKYLWDDVFKRNAATVIFKKGSGNDEFKSLSELIDAFEKETGQMTEAFDKVFKLSDDDKRNLIKDINGVSQQDDLAGKGSMEGETVADV